MATGGCHDAKDLAENWSGSRAGQQRSKTPRPGPTACQSSTTKWGPGAHTREPGAGAVAQCLKLLAILSEDRALYNSGMYLSLVPRESSGLYGQYTCM